MDWLDSRGRSLCKGPVYGPLGLEIHCAAIGAEKFIEHAIPSSLMLAFVVEHDDDWKLLSRAKLDLKVRVNIGTATKEHLSHKCSLPDGAKWLDDAVEGYLFTNSCFPLIFV